MLSVEESGGSKHHRYAHLDVLRGLVIGTEMRLVKGAGDGCWLSPFRSDTLALHFSFRHDQNAALVACLEIQRCLAPFGCRAHWGKLFDAQELRRHPTLYPAMPKFRNAANTSILSCSSS